MVVLDLDNQDCRHQESIYDKYIIYVNYIKHTYGELAKSGERGGGD